MSTHINSKPFSFFVRYAPILVHLFVYTVTCFTASVCFYFGYKPILVFAEYFSGARVPTAYTLQQSMVLWALLLGGPALFVAGFYMAMRKRMNSVYHYIQIIAGHPTHVVPIWIPMVLFGLSACLGFYDLGRAGAFSRLGVWGDYGAWIEGRWALFATLGYFNFVNLYMILPVSTAWFILSAWKIDWATALLRFLAVAIVMVMLFQKKALIVSLITIFGAMFLHRILSGNLSSRLSRFFLLSTVFLATVYFSLVVFPIYSETSRTASQALLQDKLPEKTKEDDNNIEKTRMISLVNEINNYIGKNRNAHVFAYTILAPMTRTSLPAMYYPIVFPDIHAYYGFDFGQDILGVGRMPDDNIEIWKYMYPAVPGGSAAAPFQFVFYSQVGIGWALLLCCIGGLLLGWMWNIILMTDIDVIYRSLWGSGVILFAIYLAIDSTRNSLLSSYGLIWPWLFITVSFLIIGLFVNRPRAIPAE